MYLSVNTVCTILGSEISLIYSVIYKTDMVCVRIKLGWFYLIFPGLQSFSLHIFIYYIVGEFDYFLLIELIMVL